MNLPTKFMIKLHPSLKRELKRKSLERGIDLSAYIQEALWRHCPEADTELVSSTHQKNTVAIQHYTLDDALCIIDNYNH